MATLKSTTITGTGFLKLPKGTSGQRPTPAEGQIRYNTEDNNIEYYSNLHARGWSKMTIPFLTRTIITVGYTIGGYQNAVTWRNVNRTNASTDVTYDLGDQIDRSHNYKGGFCTRTRHWTFGAGNAHATASNVTTGFDMTTEVGFTAPASANMVGSRGQMGVLFKEHYTAYVNGGGVATVEKFNGTTEQFVSYSGQNLGNAGEGGVNVGMWGVSDENSGIWFVGELNGTTFFHSNFTFATETGTTRTGTNPANWMNQKTINSKFGRAYGGNEGGYNAGDRYRRTVFSTNTTVNANISKGVLQCGEENYTVGQDWEYAIGTFTTAQNNLSMKFFYTTETSIQGGASMESKGVPGRSSATNGWRA